MAIPFAPDWDYLSDNREYWDMSALLNPGNKHNGKRRYDETYSIADWRAGYVVTINLQWDKMKMDYVVAI